MAVIISTPKALFKKSGASKAAPAKKRAAPVKKKAAPVKKKKGAVEAPKGPGLVEGLFDILSTNTDSLEARSRSGSTAKGAQRYIGYRGSGQKGSAPNQIDASGKKSKFGGKVFRFADKYGGNIDEYAPIFTPEERSETGDTYAAGPLGLAVWFLGLTSLLGVGGYAIYATSALS